MLNTLGSLGMGAGALGAAVGGAIHRPLVTVFVFTAVNLVAAVIAGRVSVPDAGRTPDKGRT
ncbi:MAG: hypothetical protein ACR2NR_07765 [Solirubrobacteraceae bacterium]